MQSVKRTKTYFFALNKKVNKIFIVLLFKLRFKLETLRLKKRKSKLFENKMVLLYEPLLTQKIVIELSRDKMKNQ